MEKPLFSIVIPTFNNKTYVAETVASALSQSYPNVEVVVDDNASVDGTIELLEEQFGSNPKFRLEKNSEDLNIPHGWNRAFKKSKGEFFLLLHSDNLLHPNFVSIAVELMEKHNANIAYSDCQYFEDTTPEKLFSMKEEVPPYSLLAPGKRAVGYLFRYQRMIPTSSSVFRRSCFQDRLPYNPEFQWDPDMEMMATLGKRFGLIHIPVNLAAIRTHKDQARSWKDPDFTRQYRRLLEIEHREGQSERHHFYLNWASSNEDLAVRLGELGADPKFFFRYLGLWFAAEMRLALHFFIYTGTRLGRMGLTLSDWFFKHRADTAGRGSLVSVNQPKETAA